jgi:hypothetical protein
VSAVSATGRLSNQASTSELRQPMARLPIFTGGGKLPFATHLKIVFFDAEVNAKISAWRMIRLLGGFCIL